MSQSVLVQVAQQYARLYGDVHVFFVIAQDLIHAHGAQHYALLYRGAAAGKAGTGTTDRDRDMVLIAQLHNGCNFFCAGYIDGNFGHADAVDGHGVMSVVRIDIFSYSDFFTGNFLQLS